MNNNSSKPLPPSPTSISASTAASAMSNLGRRPRGDSVNSHSPSTSSVQADREQLAQKLAEIHTSASRTDTLTTFNDFGSPPGSLPVTENKTIAGDFVQQGFSGLYSRFKEAVGGGASRQDADESDLQDSASRHSSSTANTAGKVSIAPLSRVETDAAVSVVSPALPSANSKPSLRPVLPSTAQSLAAVALDTTVIPGVVQRDGGRSPGGMEEDRGRGSSARRSLGKPEAMGLVSTVLSEGSVDAPLSPAKSVTASSIHSGDMRGAGANARTPAVIDRIAHRRSPSNPRSRSSSMDMGTAEPSSISTSAHNSVCHESFAYESRPQHVRPGELRIPGTTINEGAPEQVSSRLEAMRRQVLSKEFWMADETCKECFLCGNVFTMVRRKHHCRTCGCIFDSKCTSIIAGSRFGVSGNIRVCKGCLAVINRRYDTSGSEESGDDQGYLPAIFRSNQRLGNPIGTGGGGVLPQPRAKDGGRNDVEPVRVEGRVGADVQPRSETRSAQTPMMAIPARRMGDSNRQSAILEIDAAPQLSRPSSSRSLKSLASARPQSAGHKRHHSKHNLLGRFKGTPEDKAPFRKGLADDMGRRPKLPAFHDDNIIDPELAAYMSDESSGDEQMSIFATLSNNDLPALASYDNSKPNFGPFLSAGKKHRIRDKSISGVSFTSRGGLDDAAASSTHLGPRSSRRRNLSNVMRSPRPKSGVFKLGPSASNEMVFAMENPNMETTKLTRSDSFRDDGEPRVALTPASKNHVRKLLQQLLQDADIPNVAGWEKALIPILLQSTDDVTPDIRGGDLMDIRHYVKFKKIPGGKPGDTSYVSGVIFTKNLALKSMPRRIIRPRIVIVSFPIEYQRHQQQFMSLQPVIEQEKEFLRVVVNRIVKLEPQVLLAEKSVSGMALEMLSAANIAVAYNVKLSVIEAVSRCAEADIISSLDMLALPTQVGFCEGFEVKTYVNNDYANRKKSYIFLSGCNPTLGCTIALRGAATNLLARMKRITEFMVYVVYNLKLETCLMRDEFLTIQADIDDNSLPPASRQPTGGSLKSMARSGFSRYSGYSGCSGAPDRAGPTVVINTAESEPPTQASLETSQSSVDLPDGEQSSGQPRLIPLHQTHDDGSEALPEDVPMPTFYSDMVARYETKILSASPFVKFRQPYLLVRAREQERRLEYLKRLRDQDMVEEQEDGEKARSQPFQLIKPEMIHAMGHHGPKQIMEVIHAVHDAEYDKALHNYQTHTRQWENYIQVNLDLFDPYSHQNIVVLYSMICTETKIPCIEPGLVTIGFYDEHVDTGMDPDCTLGQYLEVLWYRKDEICSANGCDRPLLNHHRTYVHDECRITIVIESMTKANPNDDIAMWSYCKVCERDSPTTSMSENTWKYSFGKYLELLFWSKGLRLNDQAGCPHDHNKDHVRYFTFRDTRIRIHCDPIDLLEIIVPRPRITWKVEHDLDLKNDIFAKTEERWNRFITSVKARLNGIRIDVVLPEKADACKAEVDRLVQKAQDDHAAVARMLQDTYINSKYYEVIPFNASIRDMLQRAGEWDAAFAKFEADFLPDKDVRQLTVLQLKKMFTDNESRESLPAAESNASTVDSEDRPSQIFTETEGQSTQPTDYTNPSLAESATSAKSADAESSIAVGEGAGRPPDVATAASPTVTIPRGPVAPSAPAPTPAPPAQLSREASKPPSRDEPMPPKPPSSPQAPNQPTVSAMADSAPGEKPGQLKRDVEEHNADAPAPPTTPDIKGEKAATPRPGSSASPPMARPSSQTARQLPKLQSGRGKEASRGDVPDAPLEGSIKAEKKLADRLVTAFKGRKPGQSGIPRLVHKKKESRVSTLARHFEQLSKEFENQRIKDRKKRAEKMRASQPMLILPRTSAQAIVEVYDDVDEAVQEPGPSDYDQKDTVAQQSEPVSAKGKEPQTPTPSATAQPSDLPTPVEEKPVPQPGEEPGTEAETEDNATAQASRDGSDDEAEPGSDTEPCLTDLLPDVKEIADSLEPSTEELPKLQKSSLFKMLTNFWAERSSSGWEPLEYPVNVTDHIFIDSDIIVREDEPSSLIAFALSSEDYQAKLAHIRYQWHVQMHRDYEDDDPEPTSLPASEPLGMYMDEELEKSLLRATGTHLKYQFSEGSAKMLCKVFYAEQFDALRRKTGVADRIVESLSRCLKWDSRGGKTRAVFLKTLDDRFVLKSLSAVETAAFLSFAPAYFSIMAEALFHELPSVIAKMVGFFQVYIKNPDTNTDIKLDLLVMENLFYDRAPSRIFDLKGSMRNRKIESTGEQNEVLLDENMVEYIYESPLFAREHSKKLLRASVWNDTLFLARQNVMDYSLMIAIDEAKKELVVGIVDCIRTYTLDKKLESWIKDRGFAGGGRNRPTITSPKEYKSRFREAMKRLVVASFFLFSFSCALSFPL
jgi:1-phosphatidylinositol-3-phosphate 5-kinase